MGFSSMDLEIAHCTPRELCERRTENDCATHPDDQTAAENSSQSARLQGEARAYIAGAHEVFVMKTRYGRKAKYVKTLMPDTWKTQFPESFLKTIQWREDMPNFVLNLIQGRVMRLLVELATRETLLVSPWARLNSLWHDRARTSGEDEPSLKPFLLWLGPVSEPSSGAGDPLTSIDQVAQSLELLIEPQDNQCHFRLLRFPGGAGVPVFDLEHLLNSTQIRWLREQHALLRQEAVAIDMDNEAVDTLSWVWRLALYVGDHVVVDGDGADR